MPYDDIKIFSKEQISHKLYEMGVFVDFATLDNFLKRWKIEAIFENAKGEEFFDEKSCLKLYQNIAEKSPHKPKQSAINENLDVIKWHAWQDVSGELEESPKKGSEGEEK